METTAITKQVQTALIKAWSPGRIARRQLFHRFYAPPRIVVQFLFNVVIYLFFRSQIPCYRWSPPVPCDWSPFFSTLHVLGVSISFTRCLGAPGRRRSLGDPRLPHTLWWFMSLGLSLVAAGLCTPCRHLFYHTKASCKQTDGQVNVCMLFVRAVSDPRVGWGIESGERYPRR